MDNTNGDNKCNFTNLIIIRFIIRYSDSYKKICRITNKDTKVIKL